MQKELEFISVNDLVIDPSNARAHSTKSIESKKGSLVKFSQQKPIVINSKNVVIAGNGTLIAARELGWKLIGCVRSELDEIAQEAYAIADNRTGELSDWDFPVLGKKLMALKDNDWDLECMGWSDVDLEDMSWSEENSESKGLTDPDEVPEDVEPVAKRGQIYQLGEHRVMCGDSTSKEDVDLLMDGEKADMVFTDPPYNVASDSKNVAASVSKAMDDLKNSDWDKNFIIEDALKNIKPIIENGTIYIWCSHFLFSRIIEAMKDWAKFACWNVWTKPNPRPSLMKRHWSWNSELCCYFTAGKHVFNFPEKGHALASWNFNKIHVATEGVGHPTQKPIELCEYVIRHSSNIKSLVCDFFLGSGSTLIACEKTGRKCYGMEIDPHYVDVIIKRWEDFTGNKAELIS